MAKQTKTLFSALAAILASGDDMDCTFTVDQVPDESQYGANESLGLTAAQTSAYIAHIERGGADNTYEVNSGDACLGTILVLHAEGGEPLAVFYA